MAGRDRVWTALRGGISDRPPKGEILLERAWLTNNQLTDAVAAVDCLQADKVVLPIATTLSSLTQLREMATRNVFMFSCLHGPVTFFSESLGWHEFSRLMIKKPLEVKTMMIQYLQSSVQSILADLDNGCEGVVVFDDLAGDKGLLINPNFLKEFYFPAMRLTLEQLDYKNVPAIFHSDGNILSIIPLVKAAGFWGIQGLQPGIMGSGPESLAMQELKDWVFWGNFDFEGQGRLKNTLEITQEVNELLCKWADFPGFIFGSSGGLYKGLSLAEVKAAYTAVEDYGRLRNLDYTK